MKSVKQTLQDKIEEYKKEGIEYYYRQVQEHEDMLRFVQDYEAHSLKLSEKVIGLNAENRIIKLISDYFDADYNSVLKGGSQKELVKVRHLACSFIRQYTDLSLMATGDLFKDKKDSGKDHSSVIHAIKSVSDQCDSDRRYRKDFDALDNMMPFVVNFRKGLTI
jgi:chromosomal replication initiation ATPase DnaA